MNARKLSHVLPLIAMHACAGAQPAGPAIGSGDALPPSASSTPEQPLSPQSRIVEDCAATSVRPGNAVLVCQGFRLWVAQTIGEAPEITWERIRRTHMDTTGAPAMRPTTLRVLGKDFPATEYEATDGQRVVFGRVTASDGTNLVATCVSAHETFDRCLTALEAVVRDGLPAYARAVPGSPKIGGREIVMPPGCTLAGNNRMRCHSVELHWGNAKAQSQSKLADVLERALERLGSVTRTKVPCRLLEAATDCHVYRVTRPEGPLTVVATVATTPSGTFFAQCSSVDPQLGLVPPPCAQILVVDGSR
jgi:hypothetical protein